MVDEVDDEVGGRIRLSVDPIGIVIHFWILEARPISDLILLLPSQHIRYLSCNCSHISSCSCSQLKSSTQKFIVFLNDLVSASKASVGVTDLPLVLV